MRENDVRETTSANEVRYSTCAILADLRTLEATPERGMSEDEIRRVGAGQEMFLVEAKRRPVSIDEELLTCIGHAGFTSKIERLVGIATERDVLGAAYRR